LRNQPRFTTAATQTLLGVRAYNKCIEGLRGSPEAFDLWRATDLKLRRRVDGECV
jgi:hypothetical protein